MTDTCSLPIELPGFGVRPCGAEMGLGCPFKYDHPDCPRPDLFAPACAHENFEASVEVQRLTEVEDGPVVGFGTDIRVWCADCGEPMVFFGQGIPVGLLRDRPSLSVDGKELHVPLRPESSDPLTGLGLVGFTMRASMEGGAGAN